MIQIRFSQLKRHLIGLGYGYILFGVLLLILGINLLYKQYQEKPNAFLLIIIINILIFELHRARKDKSFIRLVFINSHKIYFKEYFLLTFPFIIPALFTSNFYLFFIHIALLLGISFSKISSSTKVFFPQLITFIPENNFEWKSGTKRASLPMAILWIFSLCFCPINYLSLFLLWFLTIIIAGFYKEHEPLNILLLENTSPIRFITKKLRKLISLYLAITFPIFVLYCFFHQDHLLIYSILYINMILILTFSMTEKYATYSPGRSDISILSGLIIVSSAIPFLLPLPLIMTIRNFFLAKNKLKEFL